MLVVRAKNEVTRNRALQAMATLAATPAVADVQPLIDAMCEQFDTLKRYASHAVYRVAVACLTVVHACDCVWRGVAACASQPEVSPGPCWSCTRSGGAA